jgi:hypothetical protein
MRTIFFFRAGCLLVALAGCHPPEQPPVPPKPTDPTNATIAARRVPHEVEVGYDRTREWSGSYQTTDASIVEDAAPLLDANSFQFDVIPIESIRQP